MFCAVCSKEWSSSRSLELHCTPSSGIAHRWMRIHPRKAPMQPDDTERAALAELDESLQAAADRESAESLERAQRLSEFRKLLMQELVRQLITRHLPVAIVQQLLESVRASAACEFPELTRGGHGIDLYQLTRNLWRLEDILLLGPKKKGPEPETADRKPVLEQNAELDPRKRPFTTLRDCLVDARTALARLDAIVENPNLF